MAPGLRRCGRFASAADMELESDMLEPARRRRSCRELLPMLEELDELLLVTRMAVLWLVACMEALLPRRRRRRAAPALELELELEALAEPLDMASGVIPVSMGATATTTLMVMVSGVMAPASTGAMAPDEEDAVPEPVLMGWPTLVLVPAPRATLPAESLGAPLDPSWITSATVSTATARVTTPPTTRVGMSHLG